MATTTVAPGLDPPTAAEFAVDLLAAFQSGDATYLRDRLHPEVVTRYGANQCRRHVNQFQADPDAQWTVVATSGPAPWLWMSDDLTTEIPDAWALTVDEPGTGQRDLHFAPAEGTWRWFVDCGDPR